MSLYLCQYNMFSSGQLLIYILLYLQMNGGNYLVVIFLICKSLQSESLVKQLLHRDVSETGVSLNAFRPKKETSWSIKDSMILYMFTTTCVYKTG